MIARCPRCGYGEWAAVRLIIIDGERRAYRKCQRCGLAVALAKKSKLTPTA